MHSMFECALVAQFWVEVVDFEGVDGLVNYSPDSFYVSIGDRFKLPNVSKNIYIFSVIMVGLTMASRVL